MDLRLPELFSSGPRNLSLMDNQVDFRKVITHYEIALFWRQRLHDR